MSYPQRGGFSRGTSILAALVFVAILSSIAFAVHEISPSESAAQTAAVAGRLAQMSAPSPTDAPDTAGSTVPSAAGTADTSREKLQSYIDVANSARRCIGIIQIQQDPKADVVIDASQQTANVCVAGCVYDLYRDGDRTRIVAKDITPCAGKVGAALSQCLLTVRPPSCVVETCELIVGQGIKCIPADGGENPSGSLQVAANVPKQTVQIQADPRIQDIFTATDPQRGIDSLDPWQQQVAQTAIQERIQSNQDKIESILKTYPDNESLQSRAGLNTLQTENAVLAKLRINPNIAANPGAPDFTPNPADMNPPNAAGQLGIRDGLAWLQENQGGRSGFTPLDENNPPSPPDFSGGCETYSACHDTIPDATWKPPIAKPTGDTPRADGCSIALCWDKDGWTAPAAGPAQPSGSGAAGLSDRATADASTPTCGYRNLWGLFGDCRSADQSSPASPTDRGNAPNIAYGPDAPTFTKDITDLALNGPTISATCSRATLECEVRPTSDAQINYIQKNYTADCTISEQGNVCSWKVEPKIFDAMYQDYLDKQQPRPAQPSSGCTGSGCPDTVVLPPQPSKAVGPSAEPEGISQFGQLAGRWNPPLADVPPAVTSADFEAPQRGIAPGTEPQFDPQVQISPVEQALQDKIIAERDKCDKSIFYSECTIQGNQVCRTGWGGPYASFNCTEVALTPDEVSKLVSTAPSEMSAQVQATNRVNGAYQSEIAAQVQATKDFVGWDPCGSPGSIGGSCASNSPDGETTQAPPSVVVSKDRDGMPCSDPFAIKADCSGQVSTPDSATPASGVGTIFDNTCPDGLPVPPSGNCIAKCTSRGLCSALVTTGSDVTYLENNGYTCQVSTGTAKGFICVRAATPTTTAPPVTTPPSAQPPVVTPRPGTVTGTVTGGGTQTPPGTVTGTATGARAPTTPRNTTTGGTNTWAQALSGLLQGFSAGAGCGAQAQPQVLGGTGQPQYAVVNGQLVQVQSQAIGAQQTQGFNSGLNCLGTLLRQQPPAGNGTPQPIGTCPVTSTLCQNGVLYGRNSQCVDTPITTCQYGCNGNTCATAPVPQCPTAPAKPTSGCATDYEAVTSTLSNGTTCTTGWRCTATAKPTIVMVANPPTVASGTPARIGWITTGMKSCTIASSVSDAALQSARDKAAVFTAQNVGNTSTSGSAQTQPIFDATIFTLNCVQLDSQPKSASVNVTVTASSTAQN